MSDRNELIKCRDNVNKTKNAAPVHIGKRFFGPYYWARDLVNILLSIEGRLKEAEIFVKNAIITKLVPIKSDTVILVIQSKTITSDAEII